MGRNSSEFESASLQLSSRTAKLRIWTLWIWGCRGPRIPFCAADALWGGVTHTFGQISKHVGNVLGADRAL